MESLVNILVAFIMSKTKPKCIVWVTDFNYKCDNKQNSKRDINHEIEFNQSQYKIDTIRILEKEIS